MVYEIFRSLWLSNHYVLCFAYFFPFPIGFLFDVFSSNHTPHALTSTDFIYRLMGFNSLFLPTKQQQPIPFNLKLELDWRVFFLCHCWLNASQFVCVPITKILLLTNPSSVPERWQKNLICLFVFWFFFFGFNYNWILLTHWNKHIFVATIMHNSLEHCAIWTFLLVRSKLVFHIWNENKKLKHYYTMLQRTNDRNKTKNYFLYIYKKHSTFYGRTLCRVSSSTRSFSLSLISHSVNRFECLGMRACTNRVSTEYIRVPYNDECINEATNVEEHFPTTTNLKTLDVFCC